MVDAATSQMFLDIAANEYAIPENIDATQFILDAIPLLGDSNGEFRERHVYGTLHRWIVSGAIKAADLRRIHWALLDEQALFAGIGEAGTDSAHLRAFAALLLVPSLYMHRKEPFLSPEEIERTCSQLARYLREEQDHRGYVSPQSWWVHGVAHAADAVGQLVQCPELKTESIVLLLEAVAQAMTPDTMVYAHEEDARMASAVLKLLRGAQLPQEIVEHWLTLVVPTARYEGQLPHVHIRYVNARNFIRCLYFQAKAEEDTEALMPLIDAAIAAFPQR